MPKFIVDLWLDGYETEEEQAKACEEFIKEQLDFSASSVKVTRVKEQDGQAQITSGKNAPANHGEDQAHHPSGSQS